MRGEHAMICGTEEDSCEETESDLEESWYIGRLEKTISSPNQF